MGSGKGFIKHINRVKTKMCIDAKPVRRYVSSITVYIYTSHRGGIFNVPPLFCSVRIKATLHNIKKWPIYVWPQMARPVEAKAVFSHQNFYLTLPVLRTEIIVRIRI